MDARHTARIAIMLPALLLWRNAQGEAPAPGSLKTYTLPPYTQPRPAEGRARRQLEFQRRIRQADPGGRTIQRAVFNAQNELGIILGRGVPLDSVPALMKSLLTQLARSFPGEDLTVIAYAPSNPPLRIGTARLNARTRAMTYERAR